jgi:hypothetical protein
MPDHANVSIHPDYPYYGICQERNKISKYFNHCLKESLANTGIEFITVFEYLIEENLITKTEYLHDGVHLSQKAMPFVMAEFQKRGIKL